MRILFIGAIEFSRHCLLNILENGGNVIAVISPDPAVSKFNSDFVDLSAIAQQRGVPFYQIRKISDPDSVNLVHSLKPDVIFVFGFSQLLPKSLLEASPLGCVGSH